jgi:hypothetical protein
VSIMSRGAGQPRKPAPVTAAPLPEAIGDEPCDRCGALARHRVAVVFSRDGMPRLGELLFCAHHYQRYDIALIVAGARPA